MKITATLDHTATAQLTAIRRVWTRLTIPTKQHMIRDCQMSAMVVAKGYPINIDLVEERDYFDDEALAELKDFIDTWQYVHPDTRTEVAAAALRSVGQ